MKIVAAKKILKANDMLATENRLRFEAQSIYTVNVVGSPGCGKTTLLEGLFQQLGSRISPAVIEGDIAGQIDADRMEKIGVPVVQINTEGMCHLDANMIAVATENADYHNINLLVIENVGNLVCTSGYDLGEHLRIVVLSVPEGDDKLVKYPGIFQNSDALIVTKTDLMGLCNFDIARVQSDMAALAPDADFFQVSAVRGDGIGELAEWMAAKCAAANAGGATHSPL